MNSSTILLSYRVFVSLERLNNQTDTNQRAMQLLEQNLRIATHDLEIAKKD